jgi:hypothetical protein
VRILSFKATGNLGDMMQTVALSRLLGPTTAFFRDQCKLNDPEEGPAIAAGFLLGPQGYSPEKTLFCGVWYPAYNPPFADWIAKSPHPITLSWLKNRNIPCGMVGCATLTLPRYEGLRSGELHVDDNTPGCLTHHISKQISPIEEWALCMSRLSMYARASLVHTTRIHVALPCLAMGTAVCYTGPEDHRTSIMKEIGLPHGKPAIVDVTPFANRFTSFLSTHAKITPLTKDPVLPKGF